MFHTLVLSLLFSVSFQLSAHAARPSGLPESQLKTIICRHVVPEGFDPWTRCEVPGTNLAMSWDQTRGFETTECTYDGHSPECWETEIYVEFAHGSIAKEFRAFVRSRQSATLCGRIRIHSQGQENPVIEWIRNEPNCPSIEEKVSNVAKNSKNKGDL